MFVNNYIVFKNFLFQFTFVNRNETTPFQFQFLNFSSLYLQADMFHVLKASGLLFYDSKTSVYRFPTQNGLPILIYLSVLLKQVDRLGLPFCRFCAFNYVTYHEMFGVFGSDQIIIYVIILLAFFSPHKFLADHSFVAELLPVHSRYVQFLKQYISQRYANEPSYPLPEIDYEYLFGYPSTTSTGANLGDAERSSTSQLSPTLSSGGAPSGFFSPSDTEPNHPFANRLVDFALRTLDWFLITATAPISKLGPRGLAEMQLFPPLVLEILELEGVNPAATPSGAAASTRS